MKHCVFSVFNYLAIYQFAREFCPQKHTRAISQKLIYGGRFHVHHNKIQKKISKTSESQEQTKSMSEAVSTSRMWP